jgi:hypothetical protein
MDIQKDWDKDKTYLSPSGEQAAIFIDNKWQVFHRSDSIQRTFTFQTNQEEKEFSLFSHWRKDNADREDNSGTIKHFQDY